MPILGEVKRDDEIFPYRTKTNYTKYIWAACEKCGRERWVQLNKGLPIDPTCRYCVKTITRVKRICLYCGNEFEAIPSRVRKGLALYCSKSCRGKYRNKEKSTRWKGGRSKNSQGYIRVILGRDDFFYPMAHKLNHTILEHRLIMAKHLGRCLQPFEITHHKNGIKDDNRIENLEVTCSLNEHSLNHSKGYGDGYRKGLQDGRLKQIQELKARIAELEKER